MLDPRARARLCSRLPHLGRPRRRIAHVNGHVPDDGHRQHLHPRLHRPEHARDVLRPLGHARRPRRDELRQLQFCRVRAVHCPVRRVRAARSCDGIDHPLPEVVIPSPTYPHWSRMMRTDVDRFIHIFLFCFSWMIFLCHISYVGAFTNTGFSRTDPAHHSPPCILHTNHYPTQPPHRQCIGFSTSYVQSTDKTPQSLFRGPPHSFSSACRGFLLL